MVWRAKIKTLEDGRPSHQRDHAGQRMRQFRRIAVAEADMHKGVDAAAGQRPRPGREPLDHGRNLKWT